MESEDIVVEASVAVPVQGSYNMSTMAEINVVVQGSEELAPAAPVGDPAGISSLPIQAGVVAPGVMQPSTNAAENSGHGLVGRHVRKKFGGKFYEGRVTSFDEENSWYKVEYEDEDIEDYTLDELHQILMSESGEATPARKRIKASEEGKGTSTKKQKTETKKQAAKAASKRAEKRVKKGEVGGQNGKKTPTSVKGKEKLEGKENVSPSKKIGKKPTVRQESGKKPAVGSPALQPEESMEDDQGHAVDVLDDIQGNGSGKHLLGVQMKKMFKGYGEFLGTVVDYEDVDGEFLYKVKYADGDQEHLSWSELKPLISSVVSPKKKGRPKKSDAIKETTKREATGRSPVKVASPQKSPVKAASPAKAKSPNVGSRSQLSNKGKGGKGTSKSASPEERQLPRRSSVSAGR